VIRLSNVNLARAQPCQEFDDGDDVESLALISSLVGSARVR
jgi:hypothetical protein